MTPAPSTRTPRPVGSTRSAAVVLGLTAIGLASAALGSLTPANAAVLGSVTVTPASGGNETLWSGNVTASCPSGTGDSYWTLDGPDLPRDQAILAPGNATGSGPQSFPNQSLANIRSANSGSLSASGTYFLRFNCVRAADGMVSDTYERQMAYTATSTSSGTYAFAAAPTPSATATSSAAPSATASATSSATSAPTAVPSVTSSATASASPTTSPTSSPASTASATATATASVVATDEPTVDPVPTEALSGSGSGSGSGGGLPTTGSSGSDLLALALSLSLFGGGLAVLGRRVGWFRHRAHEG